MIFRELVLIPSRSDLGSVLNKRQEQDTRTIAPSCAVIASLLDQAEPSSNPFGTVRLGSKRTSGDPISNSSNIFSDYF